MQGTCLTSDTFIIPNLFPNRADFDATLTIDSTPDLYHELSAISQEIEACRSAF